MRCCSRIRCCAGHPGCRHWNWRCWAGSHLRCWCSAGSPRRCWCSAGSPGAGRRGPVRAAARGRLRACTGLCARLPRRQRVAPRRAAVAIGGGPVRVRRAASMVRVVRPLVAGVADAIAVDVGVPVDVVVADEVVVDVDVDVVAAPAAAPAPAAAAPGRAHGDADAERDHARRDHRARSGTADSRSADTDRSADRRRPPGCTMGT